MNKRAMTGYEQMLLIILILLTIGALFFAFAKGDILTKIRNLPGYGYTPQEDEVISGLNESVTGSSLCPFRVGNVKGDYLTKQGDINLCQDLIKQTNCRGNLYSGLKLDATEVQRDVNWWPVDETVGSFSSGVISLNSNTLDVNSATFKKIQEVYPFADLSLLLKNLDGARVVGADICRDKLVTS